MEYSALVTELFELVSFHAGWWISDDLLGEVKSLLCMSPYPGVKRSWITLGIVGSYRGPKEALI